jgi:twitching motility protein PilU
MQFLDTLLQALSAKGSDLYLSVGSPPMMKIQGRMTAIGTNKLKSPTCLEIATTLLGPDGVCHFQSDKSANFAHSVPGVGRFRVNGFYQRNEIGFVIRAIRSVIPTLEELRLPPIIAQLALEKRGLILFVGATGSGKSTSLAAMIQHRNRNEAGHILTIEDPIEFLHTNAMSLVNQREVGIDAVSYQDALENALRQAPDVILMGEVRARETMDHAVAFAETGHLCLSTLHANNANQAIDRVINFFPADRRNQLLMDLSLNVKAIISQRLLRTLDGGRAAAVEVLINTPRVSDLMLNGEIHLIKETMEKGAEYGMRTFDQALLDMVIDGRIDVETALQNADSQNNLRLMIRERHHSNGTSGPDAAAWEIK